MWPLRIVPFLRLNACVRSALASRHYRIAVVRRLRTLLHAMQTAAAGVTSRLAFLASVAKNRSHRGRSRWPERLNGLPASQPCFPGSEDKQTPGQSKSHSIFSFGICFCSFIWIWMNHKLTSYKLINFHWNRHCCSLLLFLSDAYCMLGINHFFLNVAAKTKLSFLLFPREGLVMVGL